MQVVLGAAYRSFIHFMNAAGIKTKECWQVDRGDDLPAVWSCEGLGDPSYFYINGVWFCAGITAALIFLYGCYLSRSVFGGIIAISSFFFNHGEVTFSKILHRIITYVILCRDSVREFSGHLLCEKALDIH